MPSSTDPSSNPNSSSSDKATSLKEEATLLTRAQRGDRDAFVALVAPYRERVYATAMRLLGNRDDAMEVTQEALFRTFWKITGFHGHAHFYTWLYRITLNLCYRRLGTRRRESPIRGVHEEGDDAAPVESAPETLIVDPGAGPREEAVTRETTQLVRQALASLKSEDFQILVLREFEGFSYEELAVRLRLPKGTVMSRLHRARLALAEHLTRFGVSGKE